jgi:hypothetical protein
MQEPNDHGENPQAHFEVIALNGFRIRISQTPTQWLGSLIRPKKHPVLIVAGDRDAFIAKAEAWARDRLEIEARSE